MSATDAIIVGAGSWGKALAHTLVINKKKLLFILGTKKTIARIFRKLIT